MFVSDEIQAKMPQKLNYEEKTFEFWEKMG